MNPPDIGPLDDIGEARNDILFCPDPQQTTSSTASSESGAQYMPLNNTKEISHMGPENEDPNDDEDAFKRILIEHLNEDANKPEINANNLASLGIEEAPNTTFDLSIEHEMKPPVESYGKGKEPPLPKIKPKTANVTRCSVPAPKHMRIKKKNKATPRDLAVLGLSLMNGVDKKKAATKRKKRSMQKPIDNLEAMLYGLKSDQISNKPSDHKTDEAPTLSGRLKKEMIADLLSKCPQGSNLRQNRKNKAMLERASKNFGKRKVQFLSDNSWRLKGMTTSLYHHQLVGAVWMNKREKDSEGRKGGICADEMGLGKTVQTLAMMVANPASKTIPKNGRTTLVIAPAALLEQWKDEVERHVGDTLGDVMIFRASEKHNTSIITSCGIVITSYDELSRSVPFPETDLCQRLRNKRQKYIKKYSIPAKNDGICPIRQWIRNNMSGAGILHKTQWYRIVLDEGHVTKNHNTRVSFAADALNAEYRWVLSGTPLVNHITDLYALFRFWKHPEAQSLRMFNANFGQIQDEECRERLQSAISTYFIKRLKADEFLGRRLVPLPAPHQAILSVKLTPQERVLYEAVEDRLRVLLNALLEKGDEQYNLTFMIVQITRMRQLTAHPMLIENEIRLLFSVEELRAIHKTLSDMQYDTYLLQSRIAQWIAAKSTPDNDDRKLETNEKRCGICEDILMDEQFLRRCGHKFCSGCLQSYVDKEYARDDRDEQEQVCPTCGKVFECDDIKSLPVIRKSSISQALKASRAKSKDVLGFCPSASSSAWLEYLDVSGERLLAGAKLEKLEHQLHQWLSEFSMDKIIVFTQWRLFMILIGRSLKRRKVQFVYYTGDLNRERRQRAILEFRDKPLTKVMICGLKCASLGLNLAFANRVISIDLWWNTCVEQQAFGRVYRIGQKKETHFQRIVVENSVDSRLLALQNKKKKLIQDILTPNSADMASLLGRPVLDQNGRVIRIDRDYSDNNDDDSGDANSDQDCKIIETDFDDNPTAATIPETRLDPKDFNLDHDDDINDETNSESASSEGLKTNCEEETAQGLDHNMIWGSEVSDVEWNAAVSDALKQTMDMDPEAMGGGRIEYRSEEMQPTVESDDSMED